MPRQSMRMWWWINGAALALPLAFLPHFLAGGQGPRTSCDLGAGASGPRTVHAALGSEYGRHLIFFRFCEGCFREVREARVAIVGPDRSRTERGLSGDPNRLSTVLPAPPPAGSQVHLATELWDGERHLNRWIVEGC